MSLWYLIRLLKHLFPTLALSMLKQEITVDVGQRLREATLSGPVGDMMLIQGSVTVVKNRASFIS